MKDLINTVKELNEQMYGSVDFNDWTYANPNNPMVIISGYGSMKFDQLKKSIDQDLKKLSKTKNYSVLKYEIGHHSSPSTLQVKIAAAEGIVAFMNGKTYKKLIKKGQ
jgi:hypothetical protein